LRVYQSCHLVSYYKCKKGCWLVVKISTGSNHGHSLNGPGLFFLFLVCYSQYYYDLRKSAPRIILHCIIGVYDYNWAIRVP